MKFIYSAVLIILFSSLTSAQGFLKAYANKIVDANEKEVVLKGIGLGGWLVPEGYMLQCADAANSPTEIENKIESLIGTEEKNKFFERYRSNFVTRKDIEIIASLGFNSVRLPMHCKLLSPVDQPYVYLESGFVLIDSLIKRCADNKLYVILDLHAAYGGQNSGNISDYNSSYPSLWEDTSNQNRTIALWKKLAERYKDETWVGGYDLLNETNWPLPGNSLLRSLSVDITKAIRTVDNNHIIFIEGNSWANDFSGMTPAWDNNMAWSFHKYWNENSLASIQSFLNLRNSTSRPLWLGETGENNNQWFAECADLMKQNNIGWSWWTLKKLESTSGFFSVKKPPEYEAVLQYWKGQGAKPSNADCITAFTKLADNLLLDSCVFNEGVIDAIIRQPNVYFTVPFKPNVVPGYLFASDYDLGRSGYAYYDSDLGNTGGAYRNDNVDLQACTDSVTNGFNVGWTSAGEYMKYTVDVKQSGVYNITFRIASSSSGGSLQYMIDGGSYSPAVTFSATGGWQIWKNVSVNQVNFSKGTHTFQIKIVTEGFNINYIKFDLVTPTDVKTEVVNNYDLKQNYPNPFNPSTNIIFSIAKPGTVKFNVYNSIGMLVKSFDKNYDQPGSYSVEFSGEGLSSGVYFYKMDTGSFTKTKKMILIK